MARARAFGARSTRIAWSLLLGLFVSTNVSAASLKVVINEVHYHPGDNSTAGEFIEIHNWDSSEDADLSGWLLIGGVQYRFPDGTSLRAGDYLIVGSNRDLLISRYNLEPGRVFGNYTGSLDNAGETVRLMTDKGYIASFISYGDSSPWAETPDGLGPSLERVSPWLEESDPFAWTASIVVGGTPGQRNSAFADLVDVPPPTGGGDDIDIIPENSDWTYFKGLSEPPASWNDVGFDDSAWLEDPAGFGYDDGDDTTILDDMRFNYSTLYVREEFEIADLDDVEALTLRVIFDDGCIAYLNGVEVGRQNVPGQAGNPLPFDALALNSIGPTGLLTVELTNFRAALRTGTNVIAIQGLNSPLQSRDFSLHPSLTGRLSTTTRSEPLVDSGSTWRFFPGTERPPAAWAELGFNADTWDQGPASFGYGDDDDNTPLENMQDEYVTVFIRQSFEASNIDEFASLRLGVDFDDGFVAYLNGNEIARANVVQDDFDDTASTAHEAGVVVYFDLLNPSALLNEGTNVLAIQGHNASIGSSDFTLDAALVALIVEDDDDDPDDPPPVTDYERPFRDLVINELSNGGVATGWVELYNPTSQPVEIGGRLLGHFPSSRGTYEIPADTEIAANGFLLIDEASLGFELDDVESLILRTDDDRFLDALNPRTADNTYSVGRFPDGNDDRNVFVTTTPDTSNSAVPTEGIVINEIMYRPHPDNAGDEYVELHNTSDAPVDLSGWSFTRGIAFDFPNDTILAAGDYLVIASDPAALEGHYGINGVLGPYTGRLRNDAETVLLRNALGNQMDRVRYADEGSWAEQADGFGPSLELIHEDLENRFGPAWAASSGDGTPGEINSARLSDPSPIVVDVSHHPVIPSPADDVRILALFSDESPVDTAVLVYRLDGQGGSNELLMRDDGINDDGIAGNSIYGADIPAQPNQQIVRFWFRCVSDTGQERFVPEDFNDTPNLYQVENDAREDPLRPIYRLVLTANDYSEFLNRNRGSDVLVNTTIIAHGRAFYGRGMRLRGNSARSCPPLSYRLQFDHDVNFFGRKRVNMNGCNSERQWSGLDFLRRTLIPTPHAYFRRLSFNLDFAAGYHLQVEAIDEAFLERAIPDDADGNLYRGVGRADLDYRGEDFGSYRGNYQKRSNQRADDYSDVVDLCFRFDESTTSDEDFYEAIEERVDYEQWAHYFAAYAILGSTENSIVLNNGDDYFLYRRFSDDRWILLPWDLDSCFDESNQVLFRPTVDQIERFLEDPRYAPDYWCSLDILLDASFQVDQVQARLDHLAPLFPASRVNPLRQFVSARRNYILNRLERELTLSVDGGGSLCNEVLVPSQNQVSLSGKAPGCRTNFVLVAGEFANYNPQTNDWSATVSTNGRASIDIVALDRDDREVAVIALAISDESAPTPIPGTIGSDLTLRASQSPYRAGNNIAVQSGATLTIEAGVTIIVDDDATFNVAGTLVANGQEEAPVRFLSEACDSAWEGLLFQAGSNGNVLEFVEMRRASVAEGRNAAIVVDNAELSLVDCVIADANSTLLRASNGAAVQITRCAFSNATGAIRVDDSDLTLSESRISSINGIGLRVTPAGGGVEIIARNSRFDDIDNQAVLVIGANLTVERCILTASQIAVEALGAAQVALDHVTINNCSTGLRSDGSGGAAPEINLLDSIVWQSSLSLEEIDGGMINARFSDVQGGAPSGEGNISSDPSFRDVADDDFRLRALSPCRATASDASDMGAIPYEPIGEIRRYQRCDANGDGGNDLSDAIFTLLYLFAAGTEPTCAAAMDCDGDRTTDISDAIFNLSYLFGAGAEPAGNYPNCELAEIEECQGSTCSS